MVRQAVDRRLPVTLKDRKALGGGEWGEARDFGDGRRALSLSGRGHTPQAVGACPTKPCAELGEGADGRGPLPSPGPSLGGRGATQRRRVACPPQAARKPGQRPTRRTLTRTPSSPSPPLCSLCLCGEIEFGPGMGSEHRTSKIERSTSNAQREEPASRRGCLLTRHVSRFTHHASRITLRVFA